MLWRWISFVKCFVLWSSMVRRAAIDDHKTKKQQSQTSSAPSENMKRILSLCDELRDKVFPTLGIELIDGKGIETTDKDGNASIDNWRYCVPKSTFTDSSNEKAQKR